MRAFYTENETTLPLFVILHTFTAIGFPFAPAEQKKKKNKTRENAETVNELLLHFPR